MKLVIAGGGTGGHLFPGVALAEELRSREPAAEITFVGTARGIEARVLPELGWPLELIEVSGLTTVGLAARLRGLLRLPRALWQSRRLLQRLAPDVVLGVGGYASGPLVLMARLRGIPTAICEQNSIPGFTNKVLGKLVRAVFASFEMSTKFFPRKKVVVSGNPIRRDLLAKLLGASRPGPEEMTRRPAPDHSATAEVRPLSVLVCGGSQGALAVNELAADALIQISRELPLSIVHQTGAKGLDATVARYRAAGLVPRPIESDLGRGTGGVGTPASSLDGGGSPVGSRLVLPREQNAPGGALEVDCRAFIKEMAEQYQKADLIISRAGATTVAELAIAGKPALLIPFPHAAANHQELNARVLCEVGAALMHRQADLTPGILAESLKSLLNDPARRAEMGSAMKRLARPDAAAVVVSWCQAQV